MTAQFPGGDKIRRGARGLGLETQWRYTFVPAGSSHAPTPDAVYLDVGGQLAAGVLDTHGSVGVAPCTAHLVVNRPELVHGHLLEPWLRRSSDGQDLGGRQWSPALVTHLHPDFDAAVSALLVQLLVEDGDLPDWAPALAAYAASVDQGRWRVDLDDERSWRLPVHMAFLALQNLPVDPALGSAHMQRLLRGLALVRSEVDSAIAASPSGSSRAPDFLDPSMPGLGGWRRDARFADLRDALDEDSARFQEDAVVARLCEVWLPATDGGSDLEVPAFIAAAPPKSMLSKYWVRASGRPYFLCPYDPDPASSGRYRRAILSLDPTWSIGGRKPSLHGLGYALERRECEVRAVLPEGDVRPPIPRWSDGSCNNAAPWYDGRAHDFTIVDAPRPFGTELAWDEVVQIGTGPFWTAEAAELIVLLVEAAPGGVSRGPEVPRALEPLMRRLAGAMAAGTGPPFPVTSDELEGTWTAHVSFTRDLAPAASIMELRAPGPMPLEPVLAWLSEHQRQHPTQKALLVFRLHGEVWPASAVREALARHMPNSRLAASLDAQGSEDGGHIHLCGGRTLVIECGHSQPLDEVLPSELAVHVMLGDMAIDEYEETSKRILESRLDRLDPPVGRWLSLIRAGRHALVASRATSVAPRIRFLEFRGAFVPAGPPAPGAWPTAALSLAYALDLEGRQAAVERELAELGELEQTDADRSMEWLLFLIGLFGVTSTVFDWLALSEATRWTWSTYGWVALFDAPLVLIFVFLWLRRPRRG